MMQEIADEMQEATGAFHVTNTPENEVRILDICMAPGGFTERALKYNYGGKAFGITLPPTQGGHEVFVNSPRSSVLYRDITLFATEFGVGSIPSDHQDRDSFSLERPFLEHKFDLVFADGNVLRSHKRADYRLNTEGSRLINSQLILGLQRIKHGGTFIMLLHKIEFMYTMELLYTMSRFSDVGAFKSKRKHADRGTFYLIAKNVQSDSIACQNAVAKFKSLWRYATFGGDDGAVFEPSTLDDVSTQQLIDNFGAELVTLAQPIWQTQLEGLKRKNYAR